MKNLIIIMLVFLVFGCSKQEDQRSPGIVGLRSDTIESNIDNLPDDLHTKSRGSEPIRWLYFDWVVNAKKHKVFAKTQYGWMFIQSHSNDDDYTVVLNNLPLVVCNGKTYYYIRIEEDDYPFADCNEGRVELYYPYGQPGVYCWPNKIDTDWPIATFSGYTYVRIEYDPSICFADNSKMKILLHSSSNYPLCGNAFYDYDDCLY